MRKHAGSPWQQSADNAHWRSMPSLKAWRKKTHAPQMEQRLLASQGHRHRREREHGHLRRIQTRQAVTAEVDASSRCAFAILASHDLRELFRRRGDDRVQNAAMNRGTRRGGTDPQEGLSEVAHVAGARDLQPRVLRVLAQAARNVESLVPLRRLLRQEDDNARAPVGGQGADDGRRGAGVEHEHALRLRGRRGAPVAGAGLGRLVGHGGEVLLHEVLRVDAAVAQGAGKRLPRGGVGDMLLVLVLRRGVLVRVAGGVKLCELLWPRDAVHLLVHWATLARHGPRLVEHRWGRQAPPPPEPERS
mmetsp:Transcript_110879/g.308257  ORF Transcript_110879/g.308257 Transcript_110879/m.308257 type:complete len:304 (+) Transcript_110879:101-1012(+)